MYDNDIIKTHYVGEGLEEYTKVFVARAIQFLYFFCVWLTNFSSTEE
jgi:hypothetical protein